MSNIMTVTASDVMDVINQGEILEVEEVASNNELTNQEQEQIEVMECTQYAMELKRCIIPNNKGELRLNQSKAGVLLMGEYKFIKNERFFYKFNDNLGIWDKTSTKQVESLITKDLFKLCNFWNATDVNQTAKFIENMVNGSIEGDTFDKIFNKDPYSIVFNNGTLNLKIGKFEDGTFYINNYDTVRIPHNYNANADKPTKTIDFLSMITSDPIELDFIFSWMGYLMVKAYPIQKMLFLNGDGGNGKSTLIKLMTAVVGDDNTSTVSISSLVNNRFSSSLLYNKLFNTVADINSDFFDDSSVLKALTGDDTISIERKGENGFSYKNFAKMTYSCNKLPKFKDTSGGLERRLLVLDLNQDFTNLVKASDTHINDILNDTEEMEKVVSYSVKKFMEVMENSFNFIESESMVKARIDWLSDDPLVDFMEEKFEFTGVKTDFVEMAVFMKAYKMYCSDRGYKSVSQNRIIEAIKSNKNLISRGIKVSRISGAGTKYKVVGVKTINPEWIEELMGL